VATLLHFVFGRISVVFRFKSLFDTAFPIQVRVKPWVYSSGEFLVELGDPDTDRWTVAKQVVPAD
jgi:hypothetical protein